MRRVKSIDDYITNAPDEIQEKLNDLRRVIKETAPDAQEKISYSMPYYGHRGRLVYFAYHKKHIGLYVPPPIIENHKEDLKDFKTSVSAVQFPIDKELPILLIKKLVTARVKWNEKLKQKP